MPEKAKFIVDGQGNAEYYDQTLKDERSSKRPTVVKAEDRIFSISDHGLVFDSEGRSVDPYTPEALKDPKYYVDAGGRIIDLQSGEDVTQGEGKPGINLAAIREHEIDKNS